MDLNWTRPDAINVRHILPKLDEFDTGPTAYTRGFQNSDDKRAHARLSIRGSQAAHVVLSKPHELKRFPIGGSWLAAAPAAPAELKGLPGKSWLAAAAPAAPAAPTVDPATRMIAPYDESDDGRVDNSKWCSPVRHGSSTSAAVAGLVDYVYNKAASTMRDTCVANGETFVYEVRAYTTHVIRHISHAFTEMLAVGTDTLTFVMNGDLGTVDTGDRVVEGTFGRAYGDTETRIFIDAVSGDAYFLSRHEEAPFNARHEDIPRLLANGGISFSPSFIAHHAARSGPAQIYDLLECMTEHSHGICAESDWRDGGVKPGAPVYHIDEYYMISVTLDSIRAFLTNGHAVVGGFDCFDPRAGTDGVMSPPALETPDGIFAKEITGGHCVLFVGFDDKKKLLKFRNSWGRDWGDGGYGYLPYAYVTMGFVDDLWIVKH